MRLVRISQFIEILKIYKKSIGDVYVIHSSDAEGNTYNSISDISVSYINTDKLGKVFVLFPDYENIENELYEW